MSNLSERKRQVKTSYTSYSGTCKYTFLDYIKILCQHIWFILNLFITWIFKNEKNIREKLYTISSLVKMIELVKIYQEATSQNYLVLGAEDTKQLLYNLDNINVFFNLLVYFSDMNLNPWTHFVSWSIQLTHGVPQGSFLGPLQFCAMWICYYDAYGHLYLK